MPEISVVLDTHVFIEAILKLNPEYESAYDAMIQRHHRFLIRTKIIEQYETIINQKYSPPVPNFLLRTLIDLEDKKIVKRVGESKIISVNITGLQTNDRKFVELACNRAKFLVTNDPSLHSKHREFMDKCEFIVKYAVDYAENEEEN
ncbi:MAG: PIN domain-containing protein [Methanosarcinales archaeon]|nr:MAG: PIN domain-containing protein [Methanosarcinales archaeon]